ncbi:MAG: hypothetical protein JNL51_16395 [Chitinophagaceae bacterium]|nr:hypothetical protein [Chitinophagaceae bacterium]
MKRILFLALLSAGAGTAIIAQQPIVISAEGGINSASSAVKDKGYLGNGYNIQGNVFIPFFHKNNGGFTLGILAGGGYHTLKNLTPDAAPLQAAYKLYSGNLSVADGQNEGKSSKGFMGYLGVQADVSLGAFMLSPSINAGYFGLKQSGYSQAATITVSEGATQTLTLAELPESKRTGFLAIPRLKIGYPIASSLRVYTSIGVNIGPKMDIEQSVLKPEGGFNDRNTYELKQLSSGKMVERPTVSAGYQTLMVNAGLSWSLGSKTKGLKGKETPPRQSQGATFGEKAMPGNNPLYQNDSKSGDNPMFEPSNLARPGSPIGGIIVKGGKNPGGNWITVISDNNGEFEFNAPEAGNYKFTLTTPEAPQGKSINEKGVKRAEAQDFNTTRSNRDNRLATNPGADGGQTENGHQLKAQNNNTVRSNRSDNAFKGAEGADPLYDQKPAAANTTVRQTQGATFGEKAMPGNNPLYQDDNGSGDNPMFEPSSVARPGSPIGGIIVKGGKNPGGNWIKVISDNNGEFEFNGLEAGNYKFTLTTPEAPQGKSINEKGVKRVEAQDFNTTRSNRDNRLATNPGVDGEQINDSYQLKAQNNNTVRSNRSDNAYRANEEDAANNSNQLKAQNNNTVRSNRSDNAYRANEEDAANNSNQLKAQNNNTVRSNRSDNAYRADVKQTQGKTFGESMANGMQLARPGGPLKGIDVKLGKSPNGGITMKAISNEKGEVEFNGLEAGNYKISLAMPEEPQGKSINEKGVKRAAAQDFNTTRSNKDNRLATNPDGEGSSEALSKRNGAAQASYAATGRTANGDGAQARPGSPIGGIIVKGGKNPGGNMFVLTPDQDGVIQFEVKEAGNYKFVMQAPE